MDARGARGDAPGVRGEGTEPRGLVEVRQESEATAARDERGSTEERGSAEVRGSIEALARTASVREDDGGAETA